MSREFVAAVVAASIVACSREGAIKPPRPAQSSTESRVPGLPAGWRLDSSLRARKTPTCPSDPFVSEELAFLKRDVRFEFVVRVETSGRVERAELITASPSPPDQRILEYARACIASALFEKPPHQPYEMRVAVQFPARQRAYP